MKGDANTAKLRERKRQRESDINTELYKWKVIWNKSGEGDFLGNRGIYI